MCGVLYVGIPTPCPGANADAVAAGAHLHLPPNPQVLGQLQLLLASDVCVTRGVATTVEDIIGVSKDCEAMYDMRPPEVPFVVSTTWAYCSSSLMQASKASSSSEARAARVVSMSMLVSGDEAQGLYVMPAVMFS